MSCVWFSLEDAIGQFMSENENVNVNLEKMANIQFTTIVFELPDTRGTV